ncbi:sensor histidine kinase [Cupriavidus plantarum]|uniref:sensor histidine kinase n=1 Tax=Cupriavidus plantarum TaxID=942865 RepID=UPI001B0356EC|nr:sensor histidine kinase [Cupriavidus plantarum]CAG2150549.1 Adaptive-response sensory-kinase SasA [Cupriavidus plantarum]SMR67906.1 Signal transduction histidine kinase [Cupriavidus plantarum]
MTASPRSPTRSIALRLFAVSTLWVIGALVTTGLILSALFERHVDQTYASQLNREVTSLAGSLEWTPAGKLLNTRTPADPRYERPYSGAYWHVSGGKDELRSRSLWDAEFPTKMEREVPTTDAYVATGPRDQSLMVMTRTVRLEGTGTQGAEGAEGVEGPAKPPVTIGVAIDRTELRAAKRSFRNLLWLSLAVLGVGLVAAVVAQISFGLLPLKRLREALVSMHRQRETELGGTWPSEVIPLVDEINKLLARNAEAVARSRRQAADLAHAVKTPLAVLTNDIGRLPADERQRMAEQFDVMRRQVDRHLARARAAGATRDAGLVAVHDVANALVRALRRLHADRALDIEAEGEGMFPGDRQDLIEMLGNLLDNACRWARHRVRLRVMQHDDALEIEIADDGPGIPDDAREAVMSRFVRLDEQADGSGLGLAIVRDIGALYGGELRLDRAREGGLSARLRFPLGE